MASTYGTICIQKSPNLRIVITAGYIIEATFSVVVIPAVAEGIGGAEGGGHGAGGGLGIAPGVIGIGHDGSAAGVHKTYYVSLEIVNVVVCIAFVFDRDSAVTVVGEIQSISAGGGLRNQLRPIPGVGGLHAVHGFGQPRPVAAVSIADSCRALLQRGKLPPGLPGEGHAVPPVVRVADDVVGDGRAVERGQQVLPPGRGVAVGVQGRAVLGPGGDVAARVVAVRTNDQFSGVSLITTINTAYTDRSVL